jgi:hypothetical protein
MLPLVLALLLAQPAAAAPDASAGTGAVVLVVRHEGLSAMESSTLADRLGRALAEAKVPLTMSSDDAASRLGKRGAKACRNKPACGAQLGRSLGAAAVVTIDAGKIFEDLPVRVQVLDARDGTVLFDRTGTVTVDRIAELDTFFREVAQETPKALAPLPAFAKPLVAQAAPQKQPDPRATGPGQASDAPRVTPPPDLTPAPREPGVMAEAQPSPVPRYVAGGGAAVSAVAAVTFLALGLAQHGQLQARNPDNGGSPLTYNEAKATVSRANTSFTVAGICAGVAAALGVVTFALPDPQPSK